MVCLLSSMIIFVMFVFTGVILLMIGKNQSSRFTHLLKHVIKQHVAKTTIPIYYGVDRTQADTLPTSFSLSNLHAAYTEDEDYLDMLFKGIKQEYSEYIIHVLIFII